MKHPHHDIILAYLESKSIQHRNIFDGSWRDVRPWHVAEDKSLYSFFSSEWEYRIKPSPKYRVVFKTKNGMLLVSAGYYESLSAFEAYGDFQSGWEAVELIQATRKEE